MHPAEADFIGHATPRRQAEFATVRWCARRCLSDLGSPWREPLIPLPDRRPTWPPGFVGSFTHCDGFRAAAVGRSTAATIVGLGIDAEPNEPLPDRVIGRVADSAEQAHVHDLADADPTIAWDRLLFSAKEAVFKAWHPLLDLWIGFSDAELTFDPLARTFRAIVIPSQAETPVEPTTLEGRFTADDQHVLTSVVIPSLDSVAKDLAVYTRSDVGP